LIPGIFPQLNTARNAIQSGMIRISMNVMGALASHPGLTAAGIIGASGIVASLFSDDDDDRLHSNKGPNRIGE
jgi:hypothetical protein